MENTYFARKIMFTFLFGTPDKQISDFERVFLFDKASPYRHGFPVDFAIVIAFVFWIGFRP